MELNKNEKYSISEPKRNLKSDIFSDEVLTFLC